MPSESIIAPSFIYSEKIDGTVSGFEFGTLVAAVNANLLGTLIELFKFHKRTNW